MWQVSNQDFFFLVKVEIKPGNSSATGVAEKIFYHTLLFRVSDVCVCVFTRESGKPSSLLAEPRVNPLINGGLEISNVTHEDEGFYTCSVQNTNLSISAELEVLSE